MRLIHAADFHIGYSRFTEASTADGTSVIEADVARTFDIVVDRIIARAPDLVVIGGDVVHAPKPQPSAMVTLIQGFAKLTRALPDTIVVVAAGNHDLSNAGRSPGILTTLEAFGVHVADRQARRFYFPDRELSVLAVPDAPGLGRPVIAPDSRARFNALVLHGEVQGMLPAWKGCADVKARLEITNEELGLEAWNYAALGHWHQYREIAPNCFYSGSIAYTSSNVWQELSTPKGFIERDLETGAHTFHQLPAARPYFDLPPIDALGVGAEDVNTAIASAVETCGCIDGAVVRLVIHGITREVSQALDKVAMRRYRKAALAFLIVEERPERISAESRAMLQAMNAAPTEPRVHMTVSQRVDKHLETCELPPDVDRDEVRKMGQFYIGEALTKDLPRAVEDAHLPTAASEAA